MKILTAALFLLGLSPLFAGVTITLVESGADVQMTHSGTLDITSLSKNYLNQSPVAWNIYPQSAALQAGSPVNRDLYSGFTSGGSFGSGSIASASFSSGTYLYLSNGYIGLPVGFISGSSVSGSNTFASASIASLGLTAGTYVWSLPSDSITLNISASAVPEPATYAAIVGLCGFGFVVWRRRIGSSRI